MVVRLASLFRINFAPPHSQPTLVRTASATFVAIAVSLGVGVAITAFAQAIMPATQGYAHFQFADYAKLTVIGVLGGCAGWPIVTRVTSAPVRLYLTLAGLATLVLWLPDLYILYKGQPLDAVVVLMIMHVAVAIVICCSVVFVAPARQNRKELVGSPSITTQHSWREMSRPR
jgi:hypothetical protein